MSTSPRLLFVSGMFRSGTTLLGRMLNAHPRIAVASDPYLPFFKALRSREAADLGIASSPDEPLGDYYFDRDQGRLFAAIQQCRLERALDEAELPALRQRLRAYGQPYAPLVSPGLETLAGATFAKLFDAMLELVARHYGKAGAAYVGFKEVWADEFIPCLARSVPGAKFLQIVRDPRAVCASKNVTGSRYTWLFMARQWRKLAALAWRYQRQPGVDVKVIRYEDLVSEPLQSTRDLCAWLGVDHSPQMSDPAAFVDGQGKPWIQNSSYGQGAQEFARSGVDKWRGSLGPRELALIETLCGPEMLLHGYRPDRLRGTIDEGLLRDPPLVDSASLAAWARAYMRNDVPGTRAELARESLRYALLRPDGERAGAEEAFLFPELLEALRPRFAQIPAAIEI